jgi:mannose-1-phosphate guanylyltransferase
MFGPRPAAIARRRWSLILAGGNGTRLAAYVERRFGEPRPKQYCAFTGSRSMLQHTVDRASRLVRRERILTVVDSSHVRWARPQLASRGLEPLVQPVSRDTAAGVFFPLCWIRARDPDAVVYVLPSDHFVDPVDRFVDVVRRAGSTASRRPDKIVLLGVAPDSVETDYGYIELGPSLIDRPAPVEAFVEKPSHDRARTAIERGALWNTMVMAGTVDAFWSAGEATVPGLMTQLERLVDAIRAGREAALLDELYHRLPRANFSSDVLEWSDWGRAERITSTIERLRGVAGATGRRHAARAS